MSNTRNTRNTRTATVETPASIPAESIAITPAPPTAEEVKAAELLAEQERKAAYEAALETVRAFHRIASPDLVHKAALAARVASLANTAYSRLESTLPVLKAEHTIGAVGTKVSKSGNKVERDTSKLEADTLKAHKENAACVKAARLLGILPKLAGE